MRTLGVLALTAALVASGLVDVRPAGAQGGPPKVTALPVLDDPAGTFRMLPAGAEVDLVLQTPLNAATVLVDARFEAVTIASVPPRSQAVILSPDTARGFVSSVRPSGQGRSSLTLSFEELRAGAKVQRLRAGVVQVFDGKRAAEATRTGARGGVAGGIPDGGRAALAGVIIEAGGTITATDGRNVELPAGTILRIRLDQPVEIRIAGL